MKFITMNPENICISLTETPIDISVENVHIKVDETDPELIGQRYSNGTWEKTDLYYTTRGLDPVTHLYVGFFVPEMD